MNAQPMEPGLHGYDNSSSHHLEVLVTLIPLTAWATLHFGVQALWRILLSAVMVMGLDCLGRLFKRMVFRRPIKRLFSLRAAVLGMLIALPMPSTLPIWVLLAGDLLAALVLLLVGAETYLPLSLPALVGSAMLLVPAARHYPLLVDSENGRTLLSLLCKGDMPELSIVDMLLGKMDGNMGDVASLLIIVSAIYLMGRGYIHWQIPLAGIVSAGAVAYFMAPDTMSVFYYVGAHLLSGSFLLVLIYFAADRTSAPMSPKAGLVYGALYGAITILLRMNYGIDGTLPAMLITSVFSYFLDRYLSPLPFGGRL